MHYKDLRNFIQARHVMAPLIPGGWVDLGVPESSAKQQLQGNGFDYGFVRSDGKYVGFVEAAALSDTDKPLTLGSVQSFTIDFLIEEGTSISNVIDYLSRFPFQAVARRKHIVGIVDRSDLSKPLVNAYFSLVLSHLEESLVSMVRRFFPNADAWEARLPHGQRTNIEDKWRQAKDRNIELDKTCYLGLSECLRVLDRKPDVRRALGFQTVAQWKKSIEGLSTLDEELLGPTGKLSGLRVEVGELMRIEQQMVDLIDRTELREQERLLTVMFADIVGSTEFYDRWGDVAGVRMVQQFLGLTQPIIERYGGTLVKTIGDAVLAYFTEVENGVRCAIDIQRDVTKKRRRASQRIRIRAGLSHGTLRIIDNDVFGDVVNLASRLLGRAAPDEVLVSTPIFKQVSHLQDIRFQLKASNVEVKARLKGSTSTRCCGRNRAPPPSRTQHSFLVAF